MQGRKNGITACGSWEISRAKYVSKKGGAMDKED